MNRSKTAAVIITAITLSLGGMTLAQQAPGEPDTAAPDMASRWPMRTSAGDSDVTIFQPQLDDFQGDKLTARAAVSVSKAGQQEPVFGAVWLESRVATDRVARTVQIIEVNVTRTRFPGLDGPTEQSVAAAVRQALLSRPVTLSLDQLLAMVETVQKQQAAAAALQTSPPQVIFREHPTVKVQYDGPPRMLATPGSPLLPVANTPFFIVLDPAVKTYYLKGAGRWFSAPDPLGPFQAAAQVPADVAGLADASDYKDPQQPLSNSQAAALEIMTATEPTELIWTDGPPQMGTIPGTDLLYVTNTDSDMFLLIDTQQIYLLLSGRWFVAPGRQGPWTFVPPDRLPDDFRRIPPNSDKGDVLAHVAGTQAANDAVADSYIPQTATVDRHQFDQPAITYDGEPQFQPVEQTSCSYAVNCDNPVVLVSGRYYCCYNAVWYESAVARGPWGVCAVVPAPIYQLPPSCPIYGCRFVYVYGYTPDVVYCGYTPGYVGCYPFDGVVVYGTGYYYRPWWGRAVYYPRPWTFGFAAHYNSYVGHWGFSFALASGGAGRWIGEGPRSWGRRGDWFGYGGYRPVVVHNDVHVDIFRTQYQARVREGRPQQVRTDQYSRNLYDRRNDVRLNTPRGVEPLRARPGPAAAQPPVRNDVFADRSGNVYRRTVDGWQTQNKGKWESSGPPARVESNSPRGGGARSAEPPLVERRTPPAPERRAAPAPANTGGREAPGRTAAAPNRELDRDYRARVAGQERFHNYERPSAPPPERPAAPPPRPSAPPERSSGQGRSR